jgi:hypothetical protein
MPIGNAPSGTAGTRLEVVVVNWDEWRWRAGTAPLEAYRSILAALLPTIQSDSAVKETDSGRVEGQYKYP